MCRQTSLCCGHIDTYFCRPDHNLDTIRDCPTYRTDFGGPYCQSCTDKARKWHATMKIMRTMVARREQMADLAKDDQIKAQMRGEPERYTQYMKLYLLNKQEADLDRGVVERLEQCISNCYDSLADGDARRIKHAEKANLGGADSSQSSSRG